VLDVFTDRITFSLSCHHSLNNFGTEHEFKSLIYFLVFQFSSQRNFLRLVVGADIPRMRFVVTSLGSYVYGDFPKYGHDMVFLGRSKKEAFEGRRGINENCY
jgi:hypothetical protein